MSDRDGLYRVLYTDADGHEQLTAAMTYGAAQDRAKALEAQGHAVGSVMGDVAARGYMHARYAPTYRGVQIPLDLRADGVPYRVFEKWKRGVDAELDGARERRSYRGVSVPKALRFAWDQPEASHWRRGVDAAMDVMRPMVENLHDDSPCRLDHHGYCQEHGLPTPNCHDGEARRLLKKTEADR